MNIGESILRAKTVLDVAIATVRAAGHADVADTLPRLFVMVLPDLVHSHEISPIHHPPHVADALSRILDSEAAPESDWRRGLAAALLHDCAFGRIARPGERKITKGDIDKRSGQDRDEYAGLGIRQRQEHMQVGSEIAARILDAFNGWFGPTFSSGDIAEIRRVIEIHDNPSIQEYESLKEHGDDKMWLFDKDDRLIKFFREADRLWMLTDDGIDEDLERAAKDKNEVNRRAKLQYNLDRHRDEMHQYLEVKGPGAQRDYGFLGGTLYRTRSGYGMFQEAAAKL